MDIKQARKILRKDGEELTDEQVLEFINSAELLSDIFFDMWYKMTPEERKKWSKRTKKQKILLKP